MCVCVCVCGPDFGGADIIGDPLCADGDVVLLWSILLWSILYHNHTSHTLRVCSSSDSYTNFSALCPLRDITTKPNSPTMPRSWKIHPLHATAHTDNFLWFVLSAHTMQTPMSISQYNLFLQEQSCLKLLRRDLVVAFNLRWLYTTLELVQESTLAGLPWMFTWTQNVSTL